MAISNCEPTRKAIRVAIVEDNDELRETMVVLLNGTDGFECAGSFQSGESALKAIPDLLPDVVLMDIKLPKISGVECVGRITAEVPGARILMLTIFGDNDHIFAALKAGASGYLSKRTQPAQILEAIRELHAGGAPMSPEIAVRVVEYFNQLGAKTNPSLNLSPRESEILELLAQGFAYKEIADHLGIAYETVHWHIKRIYEKLHVRSKTEAVAVYLNHRLGPGDTSRRGR